MKMEKKCKVTDKKPWDEFLRARHIVPDLVDQSKTPAING